ncbi:MAG: hypothetical protein RLZZ517_58 [Candidatus Parcubacteria bacterium]|jgi:UPF0755 protein
MPNPITQKIFITVSILALLWVILTSTPLTFKSGTIVTISKGDSVKVIAHNLKENDVIVSEALFTNIVILFKLDSKIVAGDYIFKDTNNMFEVLRRISKGEYGIEVKKVTLIEGLTVTEMSNILSKEFYNISTTEFIEKALPYEGYLFPDTYYFVENVKSEEVIAKMRTTFDEKIAEQKDILTSKKSLKDIVIMASIIEKEATADSMQEVSNILWHRIAIDMPLQVDASFVYERGKHTFELSTDDLKEDSPYNTYIRYGLTPTPISNPGIAALKAAAFPKATKNLYFLTGDDGKMYYAQTLKQHEANKDKYFTQE